MLLESTLSFVRARGASVCSFYPKSKSGQHKLSADSVKHVGTIALFCALNCLCCRTRKCFVYIIVSTGPPDPLFAYG